MSLLHPFGWDLPPGVTHKDIDGDVKTEDEPACAQCNEVATYKCHCGESVCSECWQHEHKMCLECFNKFRVGS